VTRRRATTADENTDRFLEYGLDVANRTIDASSLDVDDQEGGEAGVDHRMSTRILRGLHILDNLAPEGEHPILLLLNTQGGDMHHGMAIYDAIRSCRNSVTVRVFGRAWSMGSIILQAGSQREMSPSSSLLLHYGQSSNSDHALTMQHYVAASSRWHRYFLEDIYIAKFLELDARECGRGNLQYAEVTLERIVGRLRAERDTGVRAGKPVKYRFPSHDQADRRGDAIAQVYRNELLRYDLYLDPVESFDLGLVDRILLTGDI